MSVTDMIVIGGGPTGLFTAFYAGMRNASVKIIESMPQLGGQLSALYPEKYIYDVAGFPQVTAQKLVDNLIEQNNRFNTDFCLEEKVLHIEKKEDSLFEVTTNKQHHLCKTIIITAGCGAFEPRKLNIPEIDHYTNLHYFVVDKNRFFNKNILIAGGGDSAIDWALMLEPIAKSLTLIHRRDKFRAHEHSIEELLLTNVKIITPREIEDLHGDEKIEQVTIVDKKSQQKDIIDIDELIVSFGFISQLGPIANWGLQLENGSILVNSKMETNIPGIYAAGDIATYSGKVKLIAVGFGEAPTAVNNAKRYIEPEAKLQPVHSTGLF